MESTGEASVPQLARDGATVFASYCAGESGTQRGSWWIYTEEIFGVQRDLVYGLNDPIVDDVVEITFSADLGSLRAGDVLRFRAAGNASARAFLPVVATDGLVVATDQHNNPAIVVKSHGNGQTVLCTYPLEYLAASQGRVNPEDTYRLYDALAVLAGTERPVMVADRRSSWTAWCTTTGESSPSSSASTASGHGDADGHVWRPRDARWRARRLRVSRPVRRWRPVAPGLTCGGG
jgi:hypothetical protein